MRARIAWGSVFALLLAVSHAGDVAAQESVSPFVPSDQETVARMLRMAKLSPGARVIDLGSGDGRIVIAAARAEPTVSGEGVEIDSRLVAKSNAAAHAAGVASRVRFAHRNAFDADLRRVDVIFMWLFPDLQRLLRDKILEEARPGTRVVTASFDMGSWAPDESDSGTPVVRMWKVPAKAAGNWSWTLDLGGRRIRYDAILEQRFQAIEGVVRAGPDRRVLSRAALDGAELRFGLTLAQGSEAFARQEYVGRVEGSRIRGEARVLVRRGDDYVTLVRPWSATRSAARSPYHRPTGTPDLDTTLKLPSE